jgi:hypothetical protein
MRRLLSGALTFLAHHGHAQATERHFAFTREPVVVQSGEAELQPSSTARLGRERYFSALEAELAARFGLAPNLEGSLSWILSESAEDVPDEDSSGSTRRTRSTVTGLGGAVQYKLGDPIADAAGFALRIEGGYGPNEAAVGGRALISKQSGRLLFAASAGGAELLHFDAGGTENEQAFELALAFGYFASPSVVLGVEALAPAAIDGGELRSAAIYGGPALAFTADHYWLALGVAPQLFAPESEEGGDRDLVRGEYARVRVVLGLAL